MAEFQPTAQELLSRLVSAISDVKHETLRDVSASDVQFDIPGARCVDITETGKGADAFCHWVQTVHEECGKTSFELQSCFENGSELMARGWMEIQRPPRTFRTPCSIYVRLDAGKIAAFQLLFNTHALQKFRGEFD